MDMKKTGAVIPLCIALTACLAGFRGRAEILLADPTIAHLGDRYYLLGTENGLGARPGTKASGKAVFPMYVSQDLVTWRLADTPNGEGRLLARTDAFGGGNFWAPQLFARAGRYFLAYTADFHWGLAVTERPEGPFKPYVEFPRQKEQTIDPFVFQDADGRVYAYYSCGNLCGTVGVELSSDLRSFAGTPVRCVTNDRDWERLPLDASAKAVNRRAGKDEFLCGVGYTEGPTVIRRHGKYVLFYCANDFRSPDYCVGVAVASRPLGPWRKVGDGPVLSRAVTGFGGTGHGDAFVGPDGAVWYVFHAHHSGLRVSPRRTGVIRLNERLDDDGFPRYEADVESMRLL